MIATRPHRLGNRRALSEHSPLHVPPPAPSELRERERARAAGVAHVVFRDLEGRQRILLLHGDRAVVGRSEEATVTIGWDPGVSRRHAVLRRLSDGAWAVEDAGSVNGTYVGRRRIGEPRRLADRDVLQVGDTTIAFCS